MRKFIGLVLFCIPLIIGFFLIPTHEKEYAQNGQNTLEDHSSTTEQKTSEQIFLGSNELEANTAYKIEFNQRLGDYNFRYESTSEEICRVRLVNAMGDTVFGHQRKSNFLPSSSTHIIVIPEISAKFDFYLNKKK